MNLRKMFLYHCYESNNLACGENPTFEEHIELKEANFIISVVVSSYMEIHIFLSKT
jgi:hypothetical protein